MMKVGFALLLGSLASTGLHAQIATVAVFGPMPAPEVTAQNGATTTAGSEFALYELGRWRPASAATSRPGGITLSSQTQAPSFAVVRQITALCHVPDRAPPRALATRADAGRRVYWPLIAQAECRYGLPSGLMDSVVLAESRYDPFIVSHAGAVGLAQLMPGTAADLGVADRFDPNANIQAGARYLRHLLDGFDGNVPLALAAYNAGAAAVRRVRGIPINGETPDYVRRVLALWTAPGIGPMSPMLSARQTAQMLGFAPTATN